MVKQEDALERLIAVVQQDAQARTRELVQLNAQLEQQNQLLEERLGKGLGVAKALALVTTIAMLVFVAGGYWLGQNLGSGVIGLSAQMGQMHGYLKNMAAGEPIEGQDSYMASMAHDIHRMSADIAVMRSEMTQVSGDIGVMRSAMTQMGTDIGHMNGAMAEMGGDMKDMRGNIDGMAQSLNHMGRNVGRLSRDARQLQQPFGGMMPW